MIDSRIKELRKEKSLSQEKLAKKLGVSRSTVSMWEIEQSEPDIQALIKLSSVFDCSLDYLTGKSNIKKELSENRESITADEQKLLDYFRSLNEEGQYILLSQAEALTLSGQYIKTNSAKLGEA